MLPFTTPMEMVLGKVSYLKKFTKNCMKCCHLHSRAMLPTMSLMEMGVLEVGDQVKKYLYGNGMKYSDLHIKVMVQWTSAWR